MDAILGFHMNPLTCGVAKFNFVLGGRLGLPVVQLFASTATQISAPLLSLKIEEFRPEDIDTLERLLDTAKWRSGFRLFVHAWADAPVERRLLRQAEAVYCGNAELAARLRATRFDVVELWCPATLMETSRFANTDLSVFSFGMAHKVRAEYYGKLRSLLEATRRSYSVYLSTALHEATSFDGSFTVVFEELRQIFGPHIYFLGYLSDTAVYNYLVSTTFFAAFFESGLRANNTSVNAAMQSGSVVVTNLDDYSPRALMHRVNVLDIHRCDSLPTDPSELSAISDKARATAQSILGWDGLIAAMMKV